MYESDVDLWNRDENDLKLRIQNQLYPPSFKVTALPRETKVCPSQFVRIKFSPGDNKDDDFWMNLPLDFSTPQSASVPPGI